MKRPFSAFPPVVEEEAKQITRHINALKRKSAGEKAKPVQYDSVREEMKKELESDDFLAGVHNVKRIIEAKTQNLITDSDAASAVCEAVKPSGITRPSPSVSPVQPSPC